MESPNIHVPEALAAEMDEWARLARALVAAWHQIGQQAGQAWNSNNSPFTRDRRNFRSANPNAPRNIQNAPGDYAGTYVDAIAQHVVSVAALFEKRQVALSIWPLIRAELEIAGRVYWLLDPGVATAPVSGEQRVARFIMELLASWCRARYRASKVSNRKLEKTTKSQRDRMRKEILDVFPSAQTDWADPGDEKEWSVGNETYLELGRAADRFARQLLGDVRGLYDILSDYSHPSLVALGSQSTRDDVGEGISMLSYVLERELLQWQMQLACLILYKAAHLVTGYFRIDESPLEEWADSVPPDWFKSEEEGTQ